MRVLVFDTETTGLPKSKIINPDTLNLWPHIVQFSYIIYDTVLNDKRNLLELNLSQFHFFLKFHLLYHVFLLNLLV